MYEINLNRIGFIDFDGRLMSIHNFYVEIMGSRMAGTNSVYCHTAVFDNLAGFGTVNGGISSDETADIINSVGARFVLFPTVLDNGFAPPQVNWKNHSELDFELLGQVI